jgi:peptidoglycan/xylan/chitin deacetylase (PgdA/CDA1 family)
MKPVMYHYVRPDASGLPYFPHLALSDFERQLDHFDEHYGFVSREDFLAWVDGAPAPEGVLLTFDDGLRDHVDHVLPALEKRGLFGLFYVSSGPVLTGEILDVHKVHLAVGRIGGEAALAWLTEEAPALIPAKTGATHYAAQNSDQATRTVKELFNYRLTPKERGPVLDRLLDHAFKGTPPSWSDIYLEQDDLRALGRAGMGVGAHSHKHLLSGRLLAEEEKAEIELSCAFVEAAGYGRSFGYCYPYGSFSVRTEAAVAAAGCPFAFGVAGADISEPLAKTARYALPRHNCNVFPHGAASFGNGRAHGSSSTI